MIEKDKKQVRNRKGLKISGRPFKLAKVNQIFLTPNPKSYIPKPNQKGFALIFTILILVGMLAASLVISSIILRVAHSVGKITDSEIAYYGAETAAEKILYKINKNYIDISSFILDSKTETLESAGYEQQIPILPDTTNSFEKEIGKDNSLQLDLDLNGVNYHNLGFLEISGPGQLIVITLTGGTNPEPETQSEYILPNNLNLETGKYYKLRIINNTEGDIDYTIRPNLGTLTIGTIITTKGSYRGTERILETKNPKWQIY